jgi:radical SAM superfamily enzyme with C-terminal helix-hairpin-helix motif
MEEKGLIIRKKNLKMVAVYWFTLLIDFEKENYLKNTVLKFNETVKQHISEEKLQHFIEVADTIMN